MPTDLAPWIPRLARARVLVVGDLVLDEFVYGVSDRISREAPVPVVRETRREQVLGAAANVTANLLAVGARATPLGLLGRDEAGETVRALLTERGAPTTNLVVSKGRPTEKKARILAGGLSTTPQQVARLDTGAAGAASAEETERLLARLDKAAPRAQVIVVSDYGLGVLAPRLVAALRRRAKEVPVLVDSRFDLARFGGVALLKPNVPELESATGLSVSDARTASKAARVLARDLAVDHVLVTRGHHGLTLQPREGKALHLPVHGPAEAVDVTGAGDTVLALYSAALAAGAPPELAARLANVGGGLVVQKPGTATVSPEELAAAVAE